MSTGDFKCPYCHGYNCRDSMGKNCQDRLNYQWPQNIPVYQYGPSILPILPQPPMYYTFIKTPESWQCFGCKRFYAPHINYCNCQHIDNTWSSNKIPETFDNPQ